MLCMRPLNQRSSCSPSRPRLPCISRQTCPAAAGVQGGQRTRGASEARRLLKLAARPRQGGARLGARLVLLELLHDACIEPLAEEVAEGGGAVRQVGEEAGGKHVLPRPCGRDRGVVGGRKPARRRAGAHGGNTALFSGRCSRSWSTRQRRCRPACTRRSPWRPSSRSSRSAARRRALCECCCSARGRRRFFFFLSFP